MREITTTTVDGGTPTVQVLDFFYDEAGRPFAVKVDGVLYYYITNLQGDVMQIVNSNGTTVATYDYDPYGNIISSTGSIAEINPFRYRGYVYDTETGLYYLQSRYYDPEMGRFINADAFASTGQGILGNNMFSYCLNNPANYVDMSGENAKALEQWTNVMWWLCCIDFALPIGDVVYVTGILVLSSIAFPADQGKANSTVRFIEQWVADATSASEDDDYYDDESNFGGREKIGRGKGKTPRNNQKQNKQFHDATNKILNKDQQRALHNEITGKGFGFHEIVEAAKDLWFVFIGLFDTDD